MISTFQHSILYGTLLGDAYLYPKKGIIQIEQCVEHQEYVFWLFENLKSLTTGKSPTQVKRLDKRNDTYTSSVRFYTKALFHDWRPRFYHENGMRKLPDNFGDSLDSTALAIWFLDDGGKSSSKTGVFLTVDKYTQTEIEVIQQTLKNKFQISTGIHSSGKSQSGLQQKRISITGDNYILFYNVVSPLIHEIPSLAKKKLIEV